MTKFYNFLLEYLRPKMVVRAMFSGVIYFAALRSGSYEAFAAPNAAIVAEPIQLNSGWKFQAANQVPASGKIVSSALDHRSTEQLSKWWAGIARDNQPLLDLAGWHDATVPGTVLTSLVNDGVYPDPRYGENNRKIPDTLCHQSYWYRTIFAPPMSYSGKHVWLTFNGINYIAQIWVNGQPIGTIKGAFARGRFDITSHVSIGSSNVLAVQIFPPPNPGVPHERLIAEGCPHNGGVAPCDGPTFFSTIGWDWIPTVHDRDIGIWQSVILSASGPVIIQNPHVISELPLPHTDSAKLTVQATVHNITDTMQKGVLSGTIGDIHFEQNLTLKPNESRSVQFSPDTITSLKLQNPRLWWPNGYGPQNLYTLHLSFANEKAVSDEKKIHFGIRQITYSVPGSTNLTICVNGVPVIAKGGDWTMDEIMKHLPSKRLEAEIRMHQFAHYTLIRNWVGQSSSDYFYDLCDRYGLLVWDEFWQPNPGDGPNPIDPEIYLANVREKILRFRNHPCIALWCARNEGDPPPNIGKPIERLLQTLDPDRLYQPSSTSGRGVRSTGPYYWQPPAAFYSFDTPFATEVGVISIPTLESIHSMMPSNDWNVVNDDWAMHDFCAGAQDSDVYPYLISARYGFITSLADFVRKAQLANFEDYRAMYEGRLAKLFHSTTGIMGWGSNPTHPSFAWQLYSHDLEPNASLFATRKACEPLHIMMNQSNWHLMIINSTPQQMNDLQARIAIYNLNGRMVQSHQEAVRAEASAATDLGAISFPTNLSNVHFVKLDLVNQQGRTLSENFYWRVKPEHQGDYRSLNSLPLVALDVKAERRDDGSKCELTVNVHNPSQSVALLAHLQLRRADSGERVLPVFYSDNYISLVPGEKKTLTVEFNQKDLEGEAPMLAVDGWNVTAKPVAAGENLVEIVSNTQAQVMTPNESVSTTNLDQGLAINCGGDQVGLFQFGDSFENVFLKDRQYSGGVTVSMNIAVEGTGDNDAPIAIYQSARSGSCVYTIATENSLPRMVRLLFAETTDAPGAREFNVNINGKRVLTDFDIAAAAGKGRALAKDFGPITPDNDGNLVIQLTNGSAGEPLISGIQIIPASY